MSRKQFGRSLRRAPQLTALAALVALVGCGGDGGSGGSGDPSLVAFTSASRDAVAHATAASFGVLNASGVADINSASGDRSRALGSASGWTPAGAIDVVRRILAGMDRVGMARPLAATPPQSVPCALAGRFDWTIDDRDNSLTPTVGDRIAITYFACQNDASSVLDGSLEATLNRVASLDSFGMRMELRAVTQRSVSGRFERTVNGFALADFEQAGANERVTLTADGSVTAAVRTNLPYVDTVTLRSGFRQTSVYDGTVRTAVTSVTGRVGSIAAGGDFDVETQSPIVALDAEPYPRSGTVGMRGAASSAMRLTAQSTTNVLIELDAGGDGVFEDRTTQTWEWLL